MIGESDIAALVRAFLFQLVQASTGNVVAELTSTIPAGGIPPYDMVGLLMHHMEPDPAGAWWEQPGHLAWSAPNNRDAYPVVRLSGAGDQLGNAAALTVENTGASGVPATSATLSAAAYDGTNTRSAEIAISAQTTGSEAAVRLTALADSAAHSFTTLGIEPTGLLLETATSTRDAYMVTGAWNGLQTVDLTLTTAAQFTCTVAVPGCLAGDVIHATAAQSFYCSTLSAGVSCVASVALYDSAGVLVANGRAAIMTAQSAGLRVSVPPSAAFSVPADGDYEVRILVFKSAALGVYVAGVYSMNTVTRFSRQ